MTDVIYQYWDGADTPGNTAGSGAMRAYAARIGADYIYEHNPRFVTDLGPYSPHYGAFKPIYDDRFDAYDYVLFADTDVFPVNALVDDVFAAMRAHPDADVGICEEWQQPEMRKKHDSAGGIGNTNDERWAALVSGTWNAQIPRTPEGLPRVFNSGVVWYSKAGRHLARERFIPFRDYVRLVQAARLPAFYTCDQPYLHAMLSMCKISWEVLDYRWNSSVHYMPGTRGPVRPVNDLRAGAAFVHVQLGGADHFSEEKLRHLVNTPAADWSLPL